MNKTDAFFNYMLGGGPVPHELRPKGGRFVAGGDGCIVPRSIVAQMFSKSCAYTGAPFTSQHSDMTAIVGRDNFGQTLDVDWRGTGLVGECTIVPAKSGVAHIIVEDNSDAAEHAGAAVEWLECEGDEKNDTQYKMIGKEITCREIQAYTEITDRAINRARNNLPGMLAQAFRAAIIEALERAILQGSGTGEPTGIVNTTGVLTRARDCAGAVRLNDMVGLKYTIAPRYRDDALYMLEDDAAQLVEVATIMIDSGGDLFTPTHALGIPWKATTQSPKLGSDGDAIIGDWSKYVLAMEQDIVVKRGVNNDSFRRNVTPISVYMIVGGEAVVPRAFAYLTAVGQGVTVDLCVSPTKSVTLDEPIDVLPPNVDDMTDTSVVIDYAHYEIHEGDSFLCDVLTTDTTSLCFKVPAGTNRVHLNYSWGAESKATFEIWEGRTWTQGTEVATQPIFNRNRNSLTASIVQDDSTGAFAANSQMLVTPTLVANGTEIHHEQTWSDKKETFTSRAISEFILKNGETYVILLASNDGVKGTQIILDWYEHTDSA